MKVVRRLYDWVVSWAHRPHALAALFFLSFAESSFFPIPPDVLLVALCVAQPQRAMRFAFVCTAASVLGGLAGYAIGFGLWNLVSNFFFRHIFTEALFLKAQTLYQENAFWAVFTAGFTPIPYKVFTISAGVVEISLAVFVIASILGRGLRFYLVSGLLMRFGPSVKTFIDCYFNVLSLVLTAMLIGGFVLLRWLHG